MSVGCDEDAQDTGLDARQEVVKVLGVGEGSAACLANNLGSEKTDGVSRVPWEGAEDGEG